MRMQSPCKDCKDRMVGCREKCAPWQKFEARKAVRYENNKRRWEMDYIIHGPRLKGAQL